MALNNKQVAHMWAHNTNPNATRTGSHFYFSGDTIYSYGQHFPIARNVERKGKKAVLFTTKNYSITTTRHMSLALMAIPHDMVFRVEHVRNEPVSEECKQDYTNRLNAAITHARKARCNKPFHIKHAQDIVTEANNCAQFFGFRWRLKADIAKLEQEAKEAQEKQRQKEKHLRDACNLLMPIVREYWRKRESMPEDKGAQWRKVQGFVPARLAWLRLSADKQKVETSLGAEVPASEASTVWGAVRQCFEKSITCKPGLAIGNFHVDLIESNGDMRAGCHFIPYEESQYIAETLGLTNA